MAKIYMTKLKDYKNIILIGFILSKFLLQYLLVNPQYDLHRDEYLHLDEANHLAWGYLSLPPATSWLAWLVRFLGNSIFWVKFFPALFGALTMLIVWRTIEVLKGNLYALLLGSTCILLSALLRLNFLFQPSSLDTLCWTALYFSVINYFHTDKSKWLFIAALIFAIGFLNKYNIVFLLIGLLPAIMLSGQRRIFSESKLYLAALLSLLLISPNLYWQYQNDFPVFYHLKELTATQLVHVNRWSFLREQVFYFLGSILVIAASLYALLCYAPLKRYRFLFWAMLFTLATFIYFRAKGYYAIGLYPIYIAIGSVFLGDVLHRGWKKYLKVPVLAVPVLCYLLLFKVFYSVESPKRILSSKELYQKLGLLRWEDGKDHVLPQDFADMLGWKELAHKVEREYNQLPKDKTTLVLCDNYGQAGAINYYATNKNIKAVSFNADYINWFNLDRHIHNLIRVKALEGSQDEFEKTARFFERSFIADSVTNALAREFKTTIFVFTAARIDVNQRLKAEIEKEKKHL
jgi:hypothetical protein